MSLAGRLILFIPAVLYSAGITYLSLVNLADTSVGDWGLSDKVLHAGAYFGMALVWLLFYMLSFDWKAAAKTISFICFFVIAFGILIEVLQKELTSYRELDGLDIVANTVGVILAGVLVWRYSKSLIRLKAEICSFFLKK